MSRKKLKEVYIEREFLTLLEELIDEPEVKMGLLEYSLKHDATGVVKFAVRRLLKQKNPNTTTY